MRAMFVATARSMPAQIVAPIFPEALSQDSSPSHILVADDDAGVRDVLANLLRRAGYRVACAANGEVAWVTLCAEKFDVLIADHSMPCLTGLELIRRIRFGPLSALPCILMSGKMPWYEDDLLDLVRPGMAIGKPFSFFELLTCVRSLLPLPTQGSAMALNQSVPERNVPPQPDIAWQDDVRTRLPFRPLVRSR